jgi:hypothetical protein
MSASSALRAALLIVRLAPPLRDALTELVVAVVAGQTVRARLALEAAHAARCTLLGSGDSKSLTMSPRQVTTATGRPRHDRCHSR